MAVGRISRQRWEAIGKPPLPIGFELYDEPISASPVISPIENKIAQLPISAPTQVTNPTQNLIADLKYTSPLAVVPTTSITPTVSPTSVAQSISPITTPKTVTTTPQSMPLSGALTLQEILALRRIIGNQTGALVAKYQL